MGSPSQVLRRCALAALAVAALAPGAAHAAPSEPPGTVTAAEPLDPSLWIPGTTAKALRLTYVTTDARGRRALSTGQLLLPAGDPPRGGWPVISWAHGTSGLGDACAPSTMGPALPERDRPYLAAWMRQGYAVVATDYAGLGTEGLPAYLHGRSEAHNVVDMVKAARSYARARLGAGEQLSDRWATIGQSQGAGAAIYTARHATALGGEELEYVGAVGTGTPANIETAISALGPKVPPVALTPGLTAYLSYILASLRDVHPELGLDGILTETGRRYLALAETRCTFEFEEDLEGVNVGDFLTAPVATLPGWTPTIRDYMAMPESGFDKPFFMGHGVTDVDVPFAVTAPYVAALRANRQPVTFKAYANDHSGTLIASQADTVPFVRRLFDAAGLGPEQTPATRPGVALARRVRLASALRRGVQVRVTAPALTPVEVVIEHRGRRVASARGTTTADAAATITARFTRAFRRAAGERRSVRLRLTAAGASRTVVLSR